MTPTSRDVLVYDSQSRGCIIMMDLSDRRTIASVQRWKEDLDSKASSAKISFLDPLFPFLGGTPGWATDTGSPSRKQVRPAKERGQDRAGIFALPLLASPCKVAALHKLHGFLGWAEVSAKDDHMLRETVTFLVDAMVSH